MAKPSANSLLPLLSSWAERMETPAFLPEDPAQFMHRYSSPEDQEVVALTAACLAFGQRKAILDHVEAFLSLPGTRSPAQWLRQGLFLPCLPDSPRAFYRIFSFHALRRYCLALQALLQTHGTLGEALRHHWEKANSPRKPGSLALLLASLFPQECSPLVPKTLDNANKRLNLFLRWMVRQNSPVDLGLWTWFPQNALLIPLDTHVLDTAKRLRLLPQNALPSLKTAQLLTRKMKRLFPQDPLRADFALFGAGIMNTLIS